MGGSYWDQDLLGPAITAALEPVAHLEQEWDQTKLEKRVRGYFKNAAKGLEFNSQPWNVLVEEYADKVFSSIFQALSDRPWVVQADFLLAVDAGIKENFPKKTLAGIPGALFEAAVLNAHDRAFEEQRYAPLLWETLVAMFAELGPKGKKKMYEAFEEGRKDAGKSGADTVESFVQNWVAGSVTRMRRDCQHEELEESLPLEECVNFVEALIAAGSLPIGLTAESGVPPPGTVDLVGIVQSAYAMPAFRPTHVGPHGRVREHGYGQAPVPLAAFNAFEPPMAYEPTGPPWGKGGGKAGGKVAAAYGGGKGAFAGGKGAFGGGGGGCACAGGKGAVGGKAPFQWGAQKRAPTTAAGPGAKRHKGGPIYPAGGQRLSGGHPLCTQQEDCQGGPDSELVQHMDNDVGGDVYCTSCWTAFSSADATLEAVPFAQ